VKHVDVQVQTDASICSKQGSTLMGSTCQFTKVSTLHWSLPATHQTTGWVVHPAS
jgi:hypothetical protein